MAQTVGEKLKQTRQARGLTLEQVAQATRIRKNYLEALESDQHDALPSVVQGRGFLRLYAGHLNLPVAPLLAAWQAKQPVAEEEVPPAAVEPAVVEPPIKPLASPTTVPAVSPIEPPAPSEQAALNADRPKSTDEVPSQPVPLITARPSRETPAAPQRPEPAGMSASRAIFLEVGQKLHQQRVSLGLSTAEVERFTRLRQHYILALEEGRIDDLPSPVQGRGMLSNYASFLNMHEESLLLRFAEGLQARRLERMPRPEPQAQPSKRRPAQQAPLWRRFLTPDLIFGIGVAAIILFFTLWTLARVNSLRAENEQPTPPALSEVLLGQNATATPDPLTVGLVGPVSDQPPADDPASGQAPVQEGTDITLPDPATSVARSPTANMAPANNDPLQIYIIARQRAWLRVIADDKVKFQGRVVPGNAYAFSGTKRVELVTGSGSALQVYFNQKDWGTLGLPGQVVGLVFVPGGIYTPTAAFTATPTATKPATMTPPATLTPQATPSITPFVP